MERATTALVLGGGGLFGAYQAGVWQALEGHFQPQMVVGASIGALNGLAIAGGCPAEEWIAQWLTLGDFGRPRLRLPRGVFDGLFDAAPVERFVRHLMERFQPRMRYGVVLTSLPRPRPRAFWDGAVTWRHLCASCGVPLLMRQYRIEGQWWADGGLLDAVPVQAAVEAGATRVVAVNILPARPPLALQAARGVLHAVSRYRRPPVPAHVRVIMIEPGRALGRWAETTAWERERTRAWIERGRLDAVRALEAVESLQITN
jgi:NTE family protein